MPVTARWHAEAHPHARQRGERRVVARFALDSRSRRATARTRTRNIYLADVTAGDEQEPDGRPAHRRWPRDLAACGDALMQLTVGGRNALYRINPRTGDRKEIVGGRRRIGGLHLRHRAHEGRLRRAPASTCRPSCSSATSVARHPSVSSRHFNQDLNNDRSPGHRASASRSSPCGDVEIEAWLVKPYGYEPGKKYPLVLYIHGGPHSAYNEGWFDEFQNLAGAGMWVLYTNPRGSSGYGARVPGHDSQPLGRRGLHGPR